MIDGFLRGPSWARFDPELGDVLGNSLPTDGIDGSATLSIARPDGARTAFMYVGHPCRINTYGDSFTQCHQVSDGETWQEYLKASLRSQAGGLRDRYSLRATRLVLEKARRFADENGKKRMVVLLDPSRAMDQMRRGERRYDQETVDDLAAQGFNVFDMNEVHLRDYRRSNLPYGDYLKLFFIGHYNPRVNPIFACSIKGKVVEWLDPKPITYRHADADSVDFRGDLPGRADGEREAGADSSKGTKRP